MQALQYLTFAILCFSATICYVHSFVPATTRLPITNDFIINDKPIHKFANAFTANTGTMNEVQHFRPLIRQRRSVSNVQMMGLFGLGAPEIAVILVAAAFLLGPQKLAELGKDAGKIAGELKEVPKEFQAGLKEGEQSAKLAKSQETSSSPAIDTTTSVAASSVEEKKE